MSAQRSVLTEAWMIGEKIKSSGDAALFRANVSVLALLADAYLNEIFRVLEKSQITRLEFDELICAARAERINVDDGRPAIRINSRGLEESGREAMRALETANTPPTIFRRGGSLVRVQVDEKGHAWIQRYDLHSMRGHLARVAVFFSTGQERARKQVLAAS